MAANGVFATGMVTGDIAASRRCAARYEPAMRETQREALYAAWQQMARRAVW